MIPAKINELKRSFWKHLQIYESFLHQQRNHSHRLLLLYAVECGLKFLLLREIKKSTTEDFQKHAILGDKLRGSNGHNIKYMAEYLKFPNISLPNMPCKNKRMAEPKQYHEVWRYGIEADEQVENAIEQSLYQLACKIKEGI